MDNITSQKYLASGFVLNQYQILSVLGEGGFGITYLAKDLILDRQVVIKENFPQMYASRDYHSARVQPVHESKVADFEKSKQDFLKEAKMLARLNNPNIVKIVTTMEENGAAYFIMPYVSSSNLTQYIHIKDTYRITENQCRQLTLTLLNAIDYLHKYKIYHQDIKPANILIDPTGNPILIDFGAAHETDGTQTVTIIASFGYASPEQMFGMKKEQGAWTDIYSLAASIYVLITGLAPVRSDARLFNDEMIPLAKMPELKGLYSQALLASIDKAMSPDWHQRYQSCGEWISDLGPSSALHKLKQIFHKRFHKKKSTALIHLKEESRLP